MLKHTQIIRRLLPTNCLSLFDHFVGLALKGLTLSFQKISHTAMLSKKTELNNVSNQ